MTEGNPMRQLEQALKAAADPTRTRILKLLEGGPLCVCQVQAVLGLAPSTVSKHLALLKAAGLVVDRRYGKWIEYALATETTHYAKGVLALLRGPLNREPAVVADRKRLREVLAVPLERLCSLPPSQRPTLVRTRPPRARRKEPEHA
jgi:ArsR family transcriptional regulator, arsenate/arsenite/antimonite-responsive transcriptional repressor